MPADTRPLAVFLMGATATGKTRLACALHERFPLGLISVDSAQVYCGINIGTAKPDVSTLARHPHALVDIRDPAEIYSVADFCSDASAAMYQINSAGKVPLLVGGTGLYFRALQQGLAKLPAADAKLRADLHNEAALHGWAAMHRRLEKLDSLAAQRIRPGDRQRLQRALEVITLTGRPLSAQQCDGDTRIFPWRVLKLILMPTDRTRQHARITARFDTMLDAGLLDEVAALRQREDLHLGLPAIRAVGYRQAWEYLGGHIDYATMRSRAIHATCQLAKRQLTWLRREWDARKLDAPWPVLERQATNALKLFLAVA